MLFATDKQTLDDLNIFGRHSGADSIYQLYNRCKTRGGSAALEAMFRYPLSDADAINHRSGCIKYFADVVVDFPFEPVQFDAVELYLDNNDERSRLSGNSQSIVQKISGLIAPEIEQAQLLKGVVTLSAMLQCLKDFISLPAIRSAANYQSDVQALTQLIESKELVAVINSNGKPSQEDIVVWDGIFRFRHRETIQKILAYVYQLDVYLTVARVARERSYVIANALPGNLLGLKLKGVYHPQIKHAVSNDITVTPDGNIVFLTGANMAGKSTLMKSLSIAVYLAHMGFPVAAREMEFSVFDGIYTTINLPDNLGIGASHFYAEVLRVKKIAKELSQGRRIFVLFDELFRGTNVKDAYEATIAVVKAFAQKNGSLFIISTHIMEAGEALRVACSNVRFIYMPTKMEGHQPVYTYTLQEGITDDRHGMIIIRNEGILDILAAGLPVTTRQEGTFK